MADFWLARKKVLAGSELTTAVSSCRDSSGSIAATARRTTLVRRGFFLRLRNDIAQFLQGRSPSRPAAAHNGPRQTTSTIGRRRTGFVLFASSGQLSGATNYI